MRSGGATRAGNGLYIDIVGILRERVVYYIIRCLFLVVTTRRGNGNENPVAHGPTCRNNPFSTRDLQLRVWSVDLNVSSTRAKIFRPRL